MLERPKSREETPKEGDGNGRDSLATALQQHTLRRTKFKVIGYAWVIFPIKLPRISCLFTEQSSKTIGISILYLDDPVCLKLRQSRFPARRPNRFRIPDGLSARRKAAAHNGV